MALMVSISAFISISISISMTLTGKWLCVKLLSVGGKFVKAHEFGVEKEEEPELELTSDESAIVEKVKMIRLGW